MIIRARCSGHDGYRNGRKHLVDIERLGETHVSPRDPRTIIANIPCPVCGMYWDGGSSTYILVDVAGTKVQSVKCSAACMQSASGECKCSCGGADHGMFA